MFYPVCRSGRIARSGLAFAGLLAAALGFSGAAAAKTRVVTYMVKQDFSDCINSTVNPTPPKTSIGGEALITLRTDGSTTVNIRLTRVAPNTTYHLFLKCVTLLGDIKTDAEGRGNNTFEFRTGTVGPVFAFDMYPEGAPLGNKYQSIQISFQ